MDWFKKDEEVPEVVAVAVESPRIKTDEMCTVDDCFEPKAPGQTHVCVKHVRAG